jgi:hypothetical protein
MCIYTCIDTRTHIQTCAHTHTHTRTYMYTSAHTCTHTSTKQARVSARQHTPAYEHTQTRLSMWAMQMALCARLGSCFASPGRVMCLSIFSVLVSLVTFGTSMWQVCPHATALTSCSAALCTGNISGRQLCGAPSEPTVVVGKLHIVHVSRRVYSLRFVADRVARSRCVQDYCNGEYSQDEAIKYLTPFAFNWNDGGESGFAFCPW